MIQNQEHIEAAQAAMNARNDAFKQSLSPEEQNKFDAVSRAIEILSGAKVPAILFPMLKNPEHEEAVCYQYNNVNSFVKFDQSGKLTDKDKEFLTKFNTSFSGAVMSHYYKMFKCDELGFDWRQFSYDLNTMLDFGSYFNKTGQFRKEQQ